MAIWKVSAETIEVYPHPNADAMSLAKVGMFQLVINKANGYKTGDIVVFAPRRAVLPADMHGFYCNTETGASYLGGSNKDRVSHIRLRGQLSEGVTIPLDYVLAKLGLNDVYELPLGEDISEKLGISKYEPPLPAGFGGACQTIDVGPYKQHDVEQFAIYQNEFVLGEPVILTEKIHGSQAFYLIEENGTVHVSSKGLIGKSIELLEDETNIYWRALKNTNLKDILVGLYPGKRLQAFGEAFPAQGGNWTYGADPNKPTLRLFSLFVDGVEIPKGEASRIPELKDLWVPTLYEGPFDPEALLALAPGKEQVSSKELHIREGGVLSPAVPRDSSEGFNLMVKLINPKYAAKESDDDIS